MSNQNLQSHPSYSLPNGPTGMDPVAGSSSSNNNEPSYTYSFINGTVPSYDYNDPVALNLIKEQVPVILRGADLVASAMKWDFNYLAAHIGSGAFAVFYFDEKKLLALQDKSTFKSTMVRVEMSFHEFLKRFYGDRTQERVYLQQPLNNTVGPQIAADFVQFNWSWAAEHKKEFNWGPLTSNLLLIGQKDNITPCHFDEQQNLFCPLRGRKKILLFHPENFPNLYPYPVHHPNDRQSQVNLDAPDLQKFPKFVNARGVEAVVGPGDILYIPMFWWHHVINLDDTIAINFWHKTELFDSAEFQYHPSFYLFQSFCPISAESDFSFASYRVDGRTIQGGYQAGGGTPVEYPLQARNKIAMVRNVEKLLLEALQDQNDLKELLHWVVDGRF